MPALQFPEELPVSASAQRIADTIAQSPVVIVCGETGSGKTTQLPKICALAGRGVDGRIGHTQPRRIAATSVARRIAQELGTDLGVDVGYKIRFGEQLKPTARFKLMTDGILLAETQHDRELRQYDTIIIDEAHERSLNIDFLLGYLKRLLDGPRRDSLKVIITSATIDAQRFANHFATDGQPAPVVEVSGRLYPVDVQYESDSPPDEDDDDESEIPARIESALQQLWRQGPGDVLVFLPGEREIRDAAEHLRRANNAQRIGRGDVEIVPLFARLSASEQQRVFSASNGQRIVLATNVAETSLTVPGIRYVIDTGLARVKRYRLRGKVEQLQIEAVSQAAANQRSGRCGRVSDGVCIRLYSEPEFQQRSEFTDPEVLRSSLASVILRMKALRLGDVEKFPFVDAPPNRAINDGYALLRELGAVNEQHHLTRTGEQLARLPVDPRIGRMLLAAHQSDCLSDVLVIAAALSTQDPRDRPMDKQQAADEAHKPFIDPRSDFLGLLRIWQFYQEADKARVAGKTSRGSMNRTLQKQFLSPRRIREWIDVHRQLSESVRELKWKVTEKEGGHEPEIVHRALLAGLLGNLGNKPPDEKQFLGTHQTRFVIHPSSGLSRKQPRWLMAAEMVDTGRLYARTVATLQPTWIEQTAKHLLRKHWSDPFWSTRRAQAMRYESATLYGLTIYSQRQVSLSNHDPVMAREMFVRYALAERDWPGPRNGKKPAFIAHNAQLIAQIEKLEHKIRRPDLLVDQQFLFDWFDARVGDSVVDARSFEKWFREQSKEDAGLLKLSREELLRKDAAGVDSEDFPKTIEMRGVQFKLDYQFEPGSGNDGITMSVPLSLLNQVDVNRCDWLVPGLLADKVEGLVRSLPQRMRRHLVPVPTYVKAFIERVDDRARRLPLLEAIRADAREHHAVQTQVNDFRPEVLSPHLQMNFKLIDAHGRQLDTSRSIAQLRAQHGEQAAGAFREAFKSVAGQIGSLKPTGSDDSSGAGAQQTDATTHSDNENSNSATQTVRLDGESIQLEIGQRFVRWPIDRLPELLEISEPGTGTTMVGFPAFVDQGNAITIEVFDEIEEAQSAHKSGVRRLMAIALRPSFKALFQNIPDFQNLVIAHARLGTDDDLKAGMTDGILQRAIGETDLPEDKAAFEALMVQVKPRVSLIGQELARTLLVVLNEYGTATRKIQTVAASAKEQEVKSAVADVKAQIEQLVFPGFIGKVPAAQFIHLARYLKAIVMRLERVRADPGRDTRFTSDINELMAGYRRIRKERRGQTDSQLETFRWLIEELRVSLFAQSLRTPTPVSLKRLGKMLGSLR
jgi:ATP-dependent helicase HrpA